MKSFFLFIFYLFCYSIIPAQPNRVDLTGTIDKLRNIQLINGKGKGDFLLADTLQGGEYLIRAYTEYMRNFDPRYFYHQEIKIINRSLPIELVTQLLSF